MKILFLFCDMVRADHLQNVNPAVSKGEFDLWFEKLKGIVYTNAYAPGPNTAQSVGCLYTGLYPNRNGCRETGHYPQVYLETENHIFNFFKEKNYNIYIYGTPENSKKQFVENIFDYSYLSFDPLNIIQKVKSDDTEDSFTFMTLEDYHSSIGLSPTEKIGNKIGQLHLSNTFSKIFDILPYDYWDHIFIFSDHGCKFYNESRRGLSVLDYNRTGIMMFWHKKKDAVIEKNNEIVSIMDIYPTILDIFKEEDSNLDGKSLLKSHADNYIVVENNFFIRPETGFRNTVWCYIDKDYYFTQLVDFSSPSLNKYYKVVDNKTKKEIMNFKDLEKLKYFREKIEKHSCDYKYSLKVIKQHENSIMQCKAVLSELYNDKEKPIKFSDGTKMQLNFFQQLYTVLLKRFFQIGRFFCLFKNKEKIKKLIQAMLK